LKNEQLDRDLRYERGDSLMAKPNVGDKIYVEGTIYLTHGVDDFRGGICTVKAVQSHIVDGHDFSSVEIEEEEIWRAESRTEAGLSGGVQQ
jgi:hypothetical protein